MNDIFYEFKYLHNFYDRLTFGVNAVLQGVSSLIVSIGQFTLSVHCALWLKIPLKIQSILFALTVNYEQCYDK